MFRILTVCTANICRSPVAQTFLAKKLEGNSVIVSSAGTMAAGYHFADPMMVELMVERGHQNLASHRSRTLLPSLLLESDLVLCMESGHMEWVRNIQPAALGKTRLLGHWSKREEVKDPTGLSKEHYEFALNQMFELSNQWGEKIIELGLCA